ncbi:MAG: biogenesis of lysosome-related organelles complex 1 subunit 2, partial [Prosthecochloris sp.]|nr:biogenesis of lysosome-related organelles complex 1 subunit 2 [Prosthecochloris sp.]
MKEVVRRTALLMIVALVMVAGGCQSRQQQESSRQEYVESIMAILTQVQKNLSRIQQKEAVVERLSSDIEKKEEKSAEELGRDINASIRFIDSTLQSSKNLVSRLEEENKNSAYRIASVDQLTAELRSTIEKKDREIQELKTEVQNLDRQVTELLETVDVLDEFIIEQEDKLSFAYYISGTYDDLVEKGILARST